MCSSDLKARPLIVDQRAALVDMDGHTRSLCGAVLLQPYGLAVSHAGDCNIIRNLRHTSNKRPDVWRVSAASVRQSTVLDPVRTVRVGTLALDQVRLVLLIVSLEPDDLAVALKREDVGGDAV